MPEDRRLAAIMFTDIVGYTELMGRDEDQAFQLLRKNRDIQRPLIKKYRGEWLKEMGDGILASFSSASDAVRCASEIQDACKKKEVALRIGIHEGEVVFEGGDVLGDGVNVASRLEEFAEEGSINISGAVYKDIKNKAGIVAEFIEEKTLKGVDEPVKVYRILGEGEELEPKKVEPKKDNKKYQNYILGCVVIVVAALLVWKYLPQKSAVELDKSIAVLPLEYLSEDPNKQYLADGVMDAITGHLSRIEGLRVTPRTSIEQYRETTKTASVIGEELDVSYLIEGSFLMKDDQVRLTIQLVTANDEDHLWFEEYDRNWANIFTVQSEVAQTIANEVEVAILPEVKERIEVIPTDNFEAYDMYLKGKEFYYKGNESNLNTAIHLFQQAIELDPQFALAYVWLGDAYNAQTYWSDYFKETLGDTLIYFADKALSINPDLAEGYRLRGVYYSLVKGDYDESIIQLKKAIDLNPNYGRTYWILGINYYAKSQYIEVMINYAHAKKLLKGDPTYPQLLLDIGGAYGGICDYEKSMSTFKELVDYDPVEGYRLLSWLCTVNGELEKMKLFTDKICAIDSGVHCSRHLSRYFTLTGNFSQALNYNEKYRELAIESGEDFNILMRDTHRYAYILYNLGREEESTVHFDRQVEYCKESIRLKRPYATIDGGALYNLAGVNAFLGENEMAYRLLREMEDEIFHGWFVWLMQNDYMYESLWDDEEFKQIIQRQEKKFADIRAELDKMREEGVL